MTLSFATVQYVAYTEQVTSYKVSEKRSCLTGHLVFRVEWQYKLYCWTLSCVRDPVLVLRVQVRVHVLGFLRNKDFSICQEISPVSNTYFNKFRKFELRNLGKERQHFQDVKINYFR